MTYPAIVLAVSGFGRSWKTVGRTSVRPAHAVVLLAPAYLAGVMKKASVSSSLRGDILSLPLSAAQTVCSVTIEM